MRPRLMRWIVCPLCSNRLDLIAWQTESKPVSSADREILGAIAAFDRSDDLETDVTLGALTCQSCRVYYPILNGIPRMLTYLTQIPGISELVPAERVRSDLKGFTLPGETPPTGELQVLKNFSTEWLGYRWTGENYWGVTADNMLNCKRYELGIRPGDLQQKLVLEVGIGIGGTADAFSRSEACELIGMDLGFAVDQARHYFGNNPRLHLVQASVFAPPFNADSFDVVYSHGVLHHTYSTCEAFGRLAKLPRSKKGMLYVWLYSHEQEEATLLRRTLMLIERLTRPMLSRMPSALQTASLIPVLPFYMLYQNLYARPALGKKYAASYGWNEALHAARDRFTPPFAFRHSYEEVAGWFNAHRYGNVQMLRDEPLPDGVPETYPLNVGVRGYRVSSAQSLEA